MSNKDTLIMARAIIIFDDNTLMVQYFKDYDTYITLGGHVMQGESLWDGLKRELKEESGLILESDERKPNFKYQNNYYFVLKDGDLSKNSVKNLTKTDGGEVRIVGIEEFFKTNGEKKDDFKIKPCMKAISKALEKMK